MKKNKFDKNGESLEMGTNAENAFVKAAEADNWIVKETYSNEKLKSTFIRTIIYY